MYIRYWACGGIVVVTPVLLLNFVHKLIESKLIRQRFAGLRSI